MNTSNNGGLSADSLYAPVGIALDPSGSLYVADSNNHRILVYPAGSTTATRVYGQGGSFSASANCSSGTSAGSLCFPLFVTPGPSGSLYVSDTNNNRVLYYPAGSTTASRVYGQGGSFTSSTSNKGGISASSLSVPYGIALDASGNLYVADRGNNRVLYYPAGSTTATRVYGQGGSFTTDYYASCSPGALYYPEGVAVDASGNLYVADSNFQRILVYHAGSTNPSAVYGQGGSFTVCWGNSGGISAATLSYPGAVTVDTTGVVYVSDTDNNRVLYYPAGSTTATYVYGQAGNFTSAAANNGGISSKSLNWPQGLVVDSSGGLYVADAGNNRVLFFPR